MDVQSSFLPTFRPVHENRKGVTLASAQTIDDADITVTEVESNVLQQRGTGIIDVELIEQIRLMKFNTSLSTKQKKQLVQLLIKYRNVFPSKNRPLGNCTNVRHEIDTGSHLRVKRVPWRTSYAQRVQVQNQAEEMLDKGTIRKSTSP